MQVRSRAVQSQAPMTPEVCPRDFSPRWQLNHTISAGGTGELSRCIDRYPSVYRLWVQILSSYCIAAISHEGTYLVLSFDFHGPEPPPTCTSPALIETGYSS